MKKIGIFYGSSTGTTQGIAETVASKLGVPASDVIDVSKMNADMVKEYEVLLLGTSTWGDGELQDDWYDGVKVLKGMDLSDKLVGLFGCGDSESYPDTFCDGMGILYGDLKNSGCRWIGAVPAQEYTYASSISVIDGLFVGLALDEMNESDQTDARIASWAEILKADLV